MWMIERRLAALILLLLPFSAGAAPLAKATFAGGCFWCMEPPFEKLPGVVSVVSGYTGGRVANPTYGAVSSGTTGHVEAVEVVYNPAKVSYERLLEVFWRNIDPTNDRGQFCDIGPSYRAAVFPLDAAQRRLTEASLTEVRARFDEPVVTEVLGAVEVRLDPEAIRQIDQASG